MAIGTSLGAYFPSAYEFHSQIQPPAGDEAMVKTPNQMQIQKDLMSNDEELFGGIEVGYKYIDDPDITGDQGIKFPPKGGGIEDRRDDTTLHTYQEWLDGNKSSGSYLPEDNKELENRGYTKLEKEAGMVDLDKTNLDQIIKAIQKGQTLR